MVSPQVAGYFMFFIAFYRIMVVLAAVGVLKAIFMQETSQAVATEHNNTERPAAREPMLLTQGGVGTHT